MTEQRDSISMQEQRDNILENNSNETEIDFMKYLLILWQNRKRVIQITSVFIIVGLAAALIETRLYTSKLTFAPESNGSSRSNVSTLATIMGGLQLNSGTDAYNVHFYPDIVKSTPFVADLVDVPVVTKSGESMTYAAYLENDKRWSLLALPGKVLGGLIKLVKPKKEELGPITRDSLNLFKLSKRQSLLLTAIEKDISMIVDKKTGESEISVVATDPYVAAIVLDSARAHLQRYVTKYRTQKARNNLEHYTRLAEDAHEKYREASNALAKFQDHNRGLISNAAMTESQRLQNELSIASQIYIQMKQQEELARGKVSEDNPILAVIQPASVPLKSIISKKKILIGYTFVGFLLAAMWVLRKEILSLIPLSDHQ